MKQNNSRLSARRITVLAGAIALLAGCATHYGETPIATNFETSTQRKLQAGQHWNAIANDSAEAIITALRLGKGCIAASPECESVYVAPPKEKTEFNRAYHAAFISALVARGVNVAKSAGTATTIDFDVQVVKFSPNRQDSKFHSATAIYAGLWALRGLWVSASPGVSGGAAMAAADTYRWNTSEWASGPVPQHEILITTSASSADKYLGRSTNLYYIADSDESLYKVKPTLAPVNLQVKGGE